MLTWEPPTEDVERFELFRDGARLATQSGSASSYTDDDVVPGQVYDYQIAAATDELVTTRVNVSTETPVPPLRAARLEGTFNIATRFTSKTGYGDYTRPSFGWRFVPRCQAKAPATWPGGTSTTPASALGSSAKGPLQRQVHRGDRESSARGTDDLDDRRRSRVVAGAALDGEWLATRLRGTIDQSEAAQFGLPLRGSNNDSSARLAR